MCLNYLVSLAPKEDDMSYYQQRLELLLPFVGALAVIDDNCLAAAAGAA